jgi:hypothetical protein
MARPLLAILSGLWLAAGLLGDGERFQTSYSPAERMTRPRLEAAHASVLALARARRQVPGMAGLQDYRCIFHAHAEDSVHTGGTRPEMLADAQRAGVQGIFLSDHFRPTRDFMDSWRLRTNGVLFVPGSETRGFLVSPMDSVFAQMESPIPDFIASVSRGDGLIFLSHIEERPDHPLEGLTGLEIYNRHYDAKRDLRGLITLALRLTEAEGAAEMAELLKLYPDELLASQVEYPEAYLTKWDQGTRTQRLTGVAANDCHHNQVMIVKMVDADTVKLGTIVDREESMQTFKAALRPSIRRLTAGHQPGDILVRLDFDPYFRSFHNVCTHVMASELTEPALRRAVKEGRVYVSHDWMADPTGFLFESDGARMGDDVSWRPGLQLRARFPIPCQVRLMLAGETVATGFGAQFSALVKGPGAYRLEAWLEIGGEMRPWIYSNPLYVR